MLDRAKKQVGMIERAYVQGDDRFELQFSEPVPAYSEILRNDNLCVSEFAPRGWGERVYLFLRRADVSQMVGFLDFAPPPLAVGGSREEEGGGYLLIEASLKWPDRFMGAKWLRLCCESTDYQMLGITGFECVPWIIPRPGFTNWCAQAATHTALDLCRGDPFRARPLGVFDISRIGRQRSPDESAYLGTGLGGEGLTSQGVMRAMSSGWCRLEATQKGVPFHIEGAPSSAARRIAYLRGLIRAGIPAVLCLGWDTWTSKTNFPCPGETNARGGARQQDSSSQSRHAVVLTGYMGSQEATLDDEFVVCDPTVGPFVSVRAEDLLEAMGDFRGQPGDAPSSRRLHFVMPKPAGVCQDLSSVYDVVMNIVSEKSCKDLPRAQTDALAGIDTPIPRTVDWNPGHLIYDLEETEDFVSRRLYAILKLGFSKLPEEPPENWKRSLQFAQQILDGIGVRYLWSVLIPVREERREEGHMPVLIAVPATVASSEAPSVALALAFERPRDGTSPYAVLNIVRNRNEIWTWTLS